MIPNDKKIERMINVSRMYYEQGMNQSAISKALGISRPLVSVLLTEARACGIVTITINDVESAEQLVANRLEAKYSLRRAVVVADSSSAETTNNAVSAEAFSLCFGGGTHAKNVGVGWGSMLGRMADYAETLPDVESRGGHVFPLIGGIGASYRGYHTNEIARIISGKAGLIADYLYLPAFFDSESEMEFVRHMDAYVSMSEKWDEMDLALVNISNFPSYPDLGVEYRFGNRLSREGSVGRVLAHYYDINGRVIEASVDNVMQAATEQLMHTKTVVAVCSTLLTARSVIGALALGFIDTLVLPRSLAESILDTD